MAPARLPTAYRPLRAALHRVTPNPSDSPAHASPVAPAATCADGAPLRSDLVASAATPRELHSPSTRHRPLPTIHPHVSHIRTQRSHCILWCRNRRYHQMLWFLLDADRCASYTGRPEQRRTARRRTESGGPLDRPPAAKRDARTMARSATPSKSANGTDTAAATNGNGNNGNGHGNGTKTRAAKGYRQLEPGQKATWKGLQIERRFTRPDIHPYDTVEWETREAVITNERGEAVFEQKDLEIPKSWSQLATQVVASKYFRGHLGTPQRERSAKQMIDRVADTIADWGIKDAYFATDEDAEAFRNELKDILLKQRAAFNSPVWFNVGIDEHPQCSACFINSVDDTMESHPDPGQDRGHALQVRLRRRQQPLHHPLEQGDPARRRRGQRPGLIHEGLRRLRRRDQVRRQDATRREDGDPQRRAPGRRGVHRLQAERGEEGLGADRRRLRRELQRRRGVRIGLLPELQQLRARDGRLHGGARAGRGLDDARGHHR